jgi:cephalosporin-C deacetylase
MAMFDLSLTELSTFTADLPEPDDFDDFWSSTVAEARGHDLGVSVMAYPTPWTQLDTFDVSFAGFGGTPVKAWLTVPAGATGPLPTVVQYHGYSGGRSFPHTTQVWATAGYAHLSMDTRGQGYAGGGPATATADASVDAGAAHSPGFMTAGLADPDTYYYRRVYTDAARMLEAAASLPVVDASKIIITGGSQGGGITLAASALAKLVDVEVIGSAPDVPFLCAFPRALQITDAHPYGEITRYLAGWRDQVATAYRTLSYFDGALLGQRASAPALFSVALMDQVCPPSTVFAAYNRYGSTANPGVAKDIKIYSHNGHEGGGAYQTVAQAEFFAGLLG